MSDCHTEFLTLFLQGQAAIDAFVHMVTRDRNAALIKESSLRTFAWHAGVPVGCAW